MANKIIIPKGGLAVEAEYNEQVIEEYKNNPFIETLPPIFSTEEAAEKLAIYPPYNPEERNLDKQYRIHLIQRLFQCFQPLMIHLDLESRISRVIRQGYLARNPFSPEFAQGLHEGFCEITGLQKELSSNISFRTTAAGFTIIGVSGMGKTTAINRVLTLYPQVITHSKYKNVNFSMYQIVWLKLDCPFDGSLKGLCIEFFRKIDDLLGTNYFKRFGSGKKSIDSMLNHMAQVARNTGLGLLVIDEIQHLNRAKSGGDQKMLNFFVTLVNTISVPVILVGTPAGLSILQSEFRQARRGSGQGDMIWDRLKKDQNFDLLLSALWDYQWTNQEVSLTNELKNVFYEESQGIIDIAVKLYAMAQIQAVLTNKEGITIESVKQVADQQLQLVKPMLKALKSGNIKEIAKYEDIVTVDVDFLGFMERERASVDLEMKIEALKRTNSKRQQEMNLSVKEEAVLKLIELKIDADKAKAAINMAVKEKDSWDSSELVLKAIEIIKLSDKREKRRKRPDAVVENDIRNLVMEGRKENLSAYETLKEKGFIKEYERDFHKVG